MAIFLAFSSVGVAAVNYFAIRAIVTKAGFSSRWALVTVVPYVISILGLMTVAAEAHTGNVVDALSALGVVWILLLLTAFADWVLFLIFAFSTWPNVPSKYDTWRASNKEREVERTTLRMARPTGPLVARALGPTSPQARPVPDVTDDSTVASRTVYCVRCGASMDEGGAFFHECPPNAPPGHFCRECGTSVEPDVTTCPNGHVVAT